MRQIVPGLAQWRQLLMSGYALVLTSVPVVLRAADAPDSAGDSVYQYTVLTQGVSVRSDIIRVLRSDGTFAQIFHLSSNAAYPDSPTTGTYTYTKTAADTAVLSMTLAGATSAEVHTLRFGTMPSPSFGAGLSGGPFHLTPLPLTEPLINTSQRSWVSFEEPSILGFVIPSGRKAIVLVRAIGPGLAAFAGTTPASNPKLDVYAEGQLLWSNDDWELPTGQSTAVASVGQTVEAISAFVGAFPLASGAHDAAIVLFLPRGQYTVQVRNAAGQPRGEALGEIYVVNSFPEN